MTERWEPDYLDLKVIKDLEKIKKVKENCEKVIKMIKDLENSNYEFIHYNPLIASLLLEERVPVEDPDVYITSKGEKCYLPKFFYSEHLDDLEDLKKILEQLESIKKEVSYKFTKDVLKKQ